MRVLPILFNTDMVRALLEGRKTVTRRVVRPDAVNRIVEDENGKCVGSYSLYHPEWDVYPTVDDAPYQPGDILYVRETWSMISEWTNVDPNVGMFDGYIYKADWTDDEHPRWRPSIHMPKEAARIFLRVKSVRVEKLQDITEEQARAEGPRRSDYQTPEWYESRKEFAYSSQIAAFAGLWDSLLKSADRDKYGWDADPWVWVIEFERVDKPEGWPGEAE